MYLDPKGARTTNTLMDSQQQRAMKTMICSNCGGLGHLYRHCNHPITSFGCIVFRLRYDTFSNCMFPEYLMVQRKDSLAYVEFVRGKYDLKNITYLLNLFSNMTSDEHAKILNYTFDEMWRDLWSPNGRQFMKEYHTAKTNFDSLRRGYLIRGATGAVSRVDAAYFVNHVSEKLLETEWGFPKGRRNFFEDDKRCALREFREETGINLAQIRILRDLKPVEEIFSGTNRLRYKHVYYIAKFVSTTQEPEVLFDPTNRHQAREIRDVRWFPYKEAQDKIKPCNVERKELLKRINNIIVRKSLALPKP